MPWLARAPHKLVIDATFKAGDMTKTFHLEFPANTPLDEIEEILIIAGVVQPRVEISGSPEIKVRQRPR
jgi:hypothetical protein